MALPTRLNQQETKLARYEMSWIHERVPPEALEGATYHQISHIRELPALLKGL